MIRGKATPNIASTTLTLLAGGLATRLRAVTDDATPKALVEVAGRPFIDHQLELFHRRGIRRAVLCLGHLGHQIESHVGNGQAFGIDVSYSHDTPGLLGTGGALRRALPMLGEIFWVVYGDSYVDIDFAAVLDAFLATDKLALMTVLRNDNRWDKSNVEFQNNRLVRYDKRNRTPAMHHVDYGVALLRRAALERIPAARHHDLADLYSMLVGEEAMMGYEVTNRFYEIGTLSALQETRQFLESHQHHPSPT
jgi:NDP-sugar pyrophosphorylase family protein